MLSADLTGLQGWRLQEGESWGLGPGTLAVGATVFCSQASGGLTTLSGGFSGWAAMVEQTDTPLGLCGD